MTWMLLVYFAGLLYLSINLDKVPDKRAFRIAWIWFALIPLSRFGFALIRAGNARDSRALAMTEIWADGVGWLLLGISLLLLSSALVPGALQIVERGEAERE